jgi:hypothetical protein
MITVDVARVALSFPNPFRAEDVIARFGHLEPSQVRTALASLVRRQVLVRGDDKVFERGPSAESEEALLRDFTQYEDQSRDEMMGKINDLLQSHHASFTKKLSLLERTVEDMPPSVARGSMLAIIESMKVDASMLSFAQ